MSLRKRLNSADWISISRILSVFIIIFLVINGARILAGTLIALSFMSDALDGYVARKKNMATKKGTLLDSVGDILLLTTGIFAVFYFEKTFMMGHLAWIGAIGVLYVLQSGLALTKYKKLSTFHTLLAKVASVLLAIFITVSVFFGAMHWLFFLAWSIAALELTEEILLVFLVPKWESNVKGLYWVMKKDKGNE